jgi:hypothetical protein
MTSAIAIGIRVLEVLFFVGSIGSLLVVALSFIDFIWAYTRDDEDVAQPPPVNPESGQPQTT